MTHFKQLKQEGMSLKEAGHLTRAVSIYKTALDYAASDQERLEIWNLIVHIHTDRMLAACEEIAKIYNCDIGQLNWNWGTHRIPNNYKTPSKEEILI